MIRDSYKRKCYNIEKLFGGVNMDWKKYIGKNIIAWLSYNENYVSTDGNKNNRCYVYPRVIRDTCELIDSKDFPSRGGVEVCLGNGDRAEEFYAKFGPLISIRINAEGTVNNKWKEPDEQIEDTENINQEEISSNKSEVRNKYILFYNSNYGKQGSQIWIEQFSGKGFYQIIDYDYDINLLKTESSIMRPDNGIYTNEILLRTNDEMLYGPFECEIKDNIVNLYGTKDNQYYIGEYKAFDYSDDLAIVRNEYGSDLINLLPKDKLIESPIECDVSYDWINQEKLLGIFFNRLRKNGSYTRKEIQELKAKLIDFTEDGLDIEFDQKRIEEVERIIQEVSERNEWDEVIVQHILDDENLKRRIIQELIENYFDLIKDKIEEDFVVQEYVENIQEKARDNVKQLEVRAKELEERIKEYKSDDFIKNMDGVKQDEINKLKKDNEDLQEKNKKLLEQLKKEKSIQELENEILVLGGERRAEEKIYNEQKEKNRKLKEEKQQIENDLNEALDRFSKGTSEVVAKTIDNKLLDKILNSIAGKTSKKEIVKFDTDLLRDHMEYDEIIEQVGEFIREKAHREEITNNDVANLLICITQGFITTFAGEPGTGKTSLCNILAKALGLANRSEQKRFVDVSVERGWTSHKDLIGYYNPLTKQMEKSNEEVFDAFEQIDSECGSDETPYDSRCIAPYIILLDEANLSSIEHYWAAFLKNCDSMSVLNRTISLGGDKIFHIPEHLRFLATVNFDHTTEELSPRFLDRSWIIMLEPIKIDDGMDNDADIVIDSLRNMVPYESLKTAFSVQNGDLITEGILTKWKDIQAIFRKYSLPIMPRNLKMVKNYCVVACRCMDCNTPSTRLAPLDYAFSQKILPTINGSGENYSKLIDDLIKECTDQNMPISSKHLRRIKEVAEHNMGFYQFFAR